MSQQHEHQGLLNAAWDLAQKVYGTTTNDAARYMENPQPACYGTHGTADHFESAVSLIKRDGQAGFDKVTKYLTERLPKLEAI